MKNCKKILAVITAVLLVMVLSACAKTATIPAGKNTVGVKNGETVGQGATAFAVEVTDNEGNKTTFTVNTDEKMVGAALQTLNLISGEKGDYGLYVKEVTGITTDYEKDGTYWAFYIDGQYALTGVDSTEVKAGAVYGFAVEKMP